MTSADDRARNEAVVRRYFAEVIDGRSVDSLGDLFDPACRVYRADLQHPIEGIERLRRFLRMSIRVVPRVETTFHRLVSDGDGSVAVHLRHTAHFGPVVRTPLGLRWTRGRCATWEAMAFFVVRDGTIREERVIRDEVSILKQLGAFDRGSSLTRRLGTWLRGAEQ